VSGADYVHRSRTQADRLDAEQQAILEKIEMVLGPDWRQEFTHLRWITSREGKVILEADAMATFGFMADGKFACVQRIGPNEVRIIIGSADHIWHKTAEMTPAERKSWHSSLAELGLTIAPD